MVVVAVPAATMGFGICRYVSPEEAEIERFWHIDRQNNNPFARRFNVSPTSIIPILRLDRFTGEIELVNARWGLIPTWWKEPKSPRLFSFGLHMQRGPKEG